MGADQSGQYNSNVSGIQYEDVKSNPEDVKVIYYLRQETLKWCATKFIRSLSPEEASTFEISQRHIEWKQD